MSEYEIRMGALEQAIAAGAGPYDATCYATEYVAFVFLAPDSMAPNAVEAKDA